jgi:hypothetical protein
VPLMLGNRRITHVVIPWVRVDGTAWAG